MAVPYGGALFVLRGMDSDGVCRILTIVQHVSLLHHQTIKGRLTICFYASTEPGSIHCQHRSNEYAVATLRLQHESAPRYASQIILLAKSPDIQNTAVALTRQTSMANVFADSPNQAPEPTQTSQQRRQPKPLTRQPSLYRVVDMANDATPSPAASPAANTATNTAISEETSQKVARGVSESRNKISGMNKERNLSNGRSQGSPGKLNQARIPPYHGESQQYSFQKALMDLWNAREAVDKNQEGSHSDECGEKSS